MIGIFTDAIKQKEAAVAAHTADQPVRAVPVELTEPPVPLNGVLVPGSKYPDEDWAMAAHRMAAGWPVVQVARAMGCHRNTIWRAFYAAPDFQARVAWERECLRREASARLRSLTHAVVVQIEQAVTRGDLGTIRWLADRLGIAGQLVDERAGALRLDAPPGPDVLDLTEEIEEDSRLAVPLDWQDAFAPDLALPE